MTYTNWTAYTTNKVRIAYWGGSLDDDIYEHLGSGFQIFSSSTESQFKKYLADQSIISLPEVILIETDEKGQCFEAIEYIRKTPLLKGLIIVLLATNPDKKLKQRARELKVHDFYLHPFSFEELAERLDFLVKFKLIKPNLAALSEKVTVTYRMPINKRLFDIAFSFTCLFFLSPLFLVVGLLILLGSKGKIFYKSKRVGTGYQIFDFYKFRSMRSDADKLLVDLSGLNQYAATENEAEKSIFVKLKNDPRVTKIGAFIRKTSIDELPQLFNILKGDMSVVGNRPLPLYEAELLTSNEWSTRFLGPAGLTGLWQISKRGREEMSERERKKLDNFYARKSSFWFDIKIILGTFPALLQKDKV